MAAKSGVLEEQYPDGSRFGFGRGVACERFSAPD
jgi:hypothetical protein